ncbi:hypothetical protein ABW21_db0201951 [Orbilia brochopaga]|nr:hypothetical protein ABW21_db0201951 [Drechslerella brochopaga]
MPEFAQPVAIAQYQNLQLHQQPPPPSADVYDEDVDGGPHGYPGSGMGVLPTGLPANGMGYSSLPLRSNSHPGVPTTTTEYLISPQSIPPTTLFPQSASLAPTQTIPSSLYADDVMQQGSVKVEASPPPPGSSASQQVPEPASEMRCRESELLEMRD